MTEQIINNPIVNADGSGEQPVASGKTFTQEEVNRLQGELRQKMRTQYGDYDQLKAQAAKWAELEERQKSEEQKLREQLDKATSEKQAAINTANQRLIEAAFITEATLARVKHPRDAFHLAQADHLAFEINEAGEVTGAKEAIQTLLQAGRLVLDKPTAPGLDGGAGGGERPGNIPTLTEEEKAIAKKMRLTEEQYAQSKRKKQGV